MVNVIRPGDRDPGTAQTPGMRREAGISAGTAGSEGLWMGTAVNAAGASSGADGLAVSSLRRDGLRGGGRDFSVVAKLLRFSARSSAWSWSPCRPTLA